VIGEGRREGGEEGIGQGWRQDGMGSDEV